MQIISDYFQELSMGKIAEKQNGQTDAFEARTLTVTKT